MTAAAEAAVRPQDRVVKRSVKRRFDWTKIGLGTYFGLFLVFLYLPVILPQTLPGIVIGSIFIFVLTMGEYGTVLVVGQNYVQSVGTIVNSYITNAVQYPQGSAAAVLLVLALVAGVFVITRFSNLREDL